MIYSEILRQVQDILVRDFTSENINKINVEIQLGDNGLGIDSLGFLNLLTKLEREFGINIADEYWNSNRLNTVGDIVNYFHSKQGD